MKKKVVLFVFTMVCLWNITLLAQRDPYLRPFANNSIWNMAIHNNAVYVDAKMNAPTAWGVTADPEIIILSPSSPNVGIYTCGWAGSTRCDKGAYITSAPIPDGWINGIPDGTPNNSTAILAQDGHTIVNLQCLHRCATSGPASSLMAYPSEDLYGDGIEGGHGGSGMGALGGSIRCGELTPNYTEAQIIADATIYIKHVIKMNVNTAIYVSNTNGGYRWPAVKADGAYNSPGACDYYGGSVPQFKMGSLLAIPKSVNVEAMGLTTGPGRMMARTLQKYGAYLVDATCWDVVAFEIQTGPHGDVESQFASKYGYAFSPQATSGAWAKDIAKIVQELFVVDSNNASNIGGGPTSDLVNRLAPAICDIGTPGSGIYDCGVVVNVPVTGVVVAPTSTSVGTGATTTLIATIVPSNATNKSVTWTSSNTAVATVNSSGVVTGVTVGSATITVKTQDGNKTATCAVTVTQSTSTKLTGTIIGTAGSWNNDAAVTKEKAMDGSLTTFFDGPVSDGVWVGLDIGSAKTISSAKYCPRAAWAARMNGGKIQGSNVADFSSVTDLYTISGSPTENTLTTAAISNSTAFRYVRYLAPNAGYGNIAELEFWSATGTTVAVTGVAVSPTTASVVAGASTTLTATVAPSNATNKSVTWTSSNTLFVTVSTTGVVTGVAAGSATITVKTVDGNKTATCAVTVTSANVAVTGVTISPTTANVVVGATSSLTATVAPSNATNKTVSWTSSNTAVATVSSAGLVTGVAIGTATITITTQDGNKTATCAVTVTTAGTSAKLTGTIIGTSGSWNNDAAFTKDKAMDGSLSTFFDGPVPDGGWVGLDLGSAKTISSAKYCPRASWAARMNGGKIQGSNVADFSSVTDLYTVTGSPAENVLSSVTITNTTPFRYVRYLSPNGGYGNIAELEFWGASGTTVAVTGVTVSPTTTNVAVGATNALTATIAPSNATNKNVTWTSSNTAVATVNSSGVVTGVAAGSASITVTTQDGNKTAICAVTVSTTTVAVTGVTVNPTTASVVVGATTTLTATVAPSNATNKNVTWTSSNSAVASVSTTGIVTGVTIGSATITVKTVDGNKTATCAVTVTAATVTNLLLTNASFESETGISYANGAWTGITGWDAFNSGYNHIGVSSGSAYDGNNKLEFQFGGWAETKAANRALVTAGSIYNCSFALSKTAVASTGANSPVTVDVKWFNSAGTLISSSSSGNLLNNTVTSAWAAFNFDATAPTGAVKAGVLVTQIRPSYPNDNLATVVADKFSLLAAGPVENVPVTGVTINPASTSVSVNNTTQLTANVLPTNATNKSISSWVSSNTSIATVSTTGLVTGKAVGTATITVTTVEGSKTATSAITVTSAPVGSLKVHCIGNSLTQAEPGYRGVLKTKLANDGYNFSYVGTKTDGTSSHSGYGGYIVGPGASQLGNIYDMWTASPNLNSVACDIIILEIGINDYFNSTEANYNPENPAAAKLDGLISLIYSTKPNVTIYVSNLTPVAWDANAFGPWNAQVPIIVNKYTNQGKKCYLADVRNGISWNLSTDISGDQLHPTSAGYTKMGNYYASLLESTNLKSASLIGNTTAVSSATQTGTLMVYPNPVTGNILNITISEIDNQGAINISLFDLSGRLIKNNKLPSGFNGESNVTLNLENVNIGMYILQVQSGTSVFRSNIIKK